MAGNSHPGRNSLIHWLGTSPVGLPTMALVVGFGGGLGAIVFRWLIYRFTWLATGHTAFGQQGWVPSSHLPWLGLAFFVIIPVIGGLIYGPMIYRFAREARGHGVPEVMLAVAENGGRIRPQVSVVKALASALCIGTGGSVGREGPIVQIGSAIASSLGQVTRMDRDRLRILVACGAGAGISATFNAPVTGVFFGFEIILRTFAIDALFPIILASAVADLVSRQAFGSAPFFTGMPNDLSIHHLRDYLLIAVLGVVAGLLGVAFKAVLYKIEDLCDKVWEPRPEWARPAVMGLGLGLLLLALPQMYGVGYPVMDQAMAGQIAVWLLVILTVGKMIATSISIGIGGSGGVFAPSLFIGAMSGTAFGVLAVHVFGPSAGYPAIYGMVAMGAVFASAARAPLTSISSVTEMTGDFGITVPVMLAVGIASAVSRRLTYGTIYTAKLLRRGIDIDAEGKAANALHPVTVSDVMRTFPGAGEQGHALALTSAETATALANGSVSAPQPGAETGAEVPAGGAEAGGPAAAAVPLSGNGAPAAGRPGRRKPGIMPAAPQAPDWEQIAGLVTASTEPAALFAGQSLDQAMHQLIQHSRYGLPVLSDDAQRIRGWISDRTVLTAIAAQAELTGGPPRAYERTGSGGPLANHRILEITVTPGSPADGRTVADVRWPPGCVIVSVTRPGLAPWTGEPGTALKRGDRVVLLAPAGYAPFG